MSTSGRQVVVRFSGPLKRPAGVGAEVTVVVPENATAEELLEAVGFDEESRPRLRLLVGGRVVGPKAPLGKAVDVTVFLPLGGG